MQLEFIDFKFPQTLQRITFLYTCAKVFVRGFINSSLLFISLSTILLADFGPKPGSLETILIKSSISFTFFSATLSP